MLGVTLFGLLLTPVFSWRSASSRCARGARARLHSLPEPSMAKPP
jgi:hypothetical protein